MRNGGLFPRHGARGKIGGVSPTAISLTAWRTWLQYAWIHDYKKRWGYAPIKRFSALCPLWSVRQGMNGKGVFRWQTRHYNDYKTLLKILVSGHFSTFFHKNRGAGIPSKTHVFYQKSHNNMKNVIMWKEYHKYGKNINFHQRTRQPEYLTKIRQRNNMCLPKKAWISTMRLAGPHPYNKISENTTILKGMYVHS